MPNSSPTLRDVLIAAAQEYPRTVSRQLQCGIYLALNHDKESASKYLERALELDPSRDEAREVLTTRPEEWHTILSLTSLALGDNDLTSLPPEIGQLANLTSLDLRRNKLTCLPPEIGQLASLTSLDLSDNDLTSLPPEIGQLASLTSLDLSYNNNLTSLPPEIGQLANLTSLDLSHTQLTCLPPEIGQLASLTSLNLSHTQLTCLPPEIGQLASLISLELYFNALLTSLPPEIGQLASLISLDLDGNNNLSSLPPEVGQLTNLQVLRFSASGPGQGSLETLPPQLFQLTNNLQRVMVRGHAKFMSLSPEIGQLASLTYLNLSDNNLTSLPPEIGQLASLTSLNLSYNNLTSLPPEIANLTKLQELNLTDNPLPIPLEILELANKPPAIINYYLQYLAQPRRPLNEAKVLLVGQGGVGKSSLIRCLIGGRFNPEERKTEGIDIQRWQLPVGEDTIRLNVWDFGGQEIMHATHQFFLTKRSLYVLVIDNRAEEDNRLEYWLKMIQSFGGDSPVIVVANKADQHPMALDRRALQRKYENIREFIATSCQTGQGMAELRDAISEAINEMPHVRDQLIATWFEVKSTLERMDEDYLSYDKYLDLCKSNDVRDLISQRTLLGFLHDLGIVLNFQDDPRLEDTNILNPEWVTSGVYSILNSDLLAQRQGVLEFSMLGQILDAKGYPRHKHHMFIIDMMRKFELCYDFEGAKDKRFLVPDLLPKEEPDTGEWEEALAFQYQYSILPSSILSRLIVRMSKQIAGDKVWRNGVVLEHGGNTALVRADREERLIYIRISGPLQGRRRLLGAIAIQLEEIHETIPGLEFEAEVPLPDRPDIVVTYNYLLELEELGEPTFIPPGYKKRVNVRELLDGVRLARGKGLLPGLHQTLIQALLKTPYFENDRSLNALFVDTRIATWRARVPAANSPQDRVQALIAYLLPEANEFGQGALSLLLEVLSEQAPEGTGLRQELGHLAQELRALGY